MDDTHKKWPAAAFSRSQRSPPIDWFSSIGHNCLCTPGASVPVWYAWLTCNGPKVAPPPSAGHPKSSFVQWLIGSTENEGRTSKNAAGALWTAVCEMNSLCSHVYLYRLNSPARNVPFICALDRRLKIEGPWRKMGKSIRRGCGISVIFSLSGFAEKNQFCSHAFPRLHFVAKFEMLQKTRSQNKDRQGRRFWWAHSNG